MLLTLLVALATATTVQLGTDESLSVPAQVKYLKEYTPLPPNLVKASVFRLPSGAILLLNVTKPDGVQCATAMDREVKQFQETQKDPSAALLFKFSTAERRLVAKHPAFYTEGGGRTAAEAKDNKPFHMGASYLMCLKQGLLNLSVVNPDGAVAAPELELLTTIAQSLKP